MCNAKKGEGINSGWLQFRSASELTGKFRAVFLCLCCVALVGLSPGQNTSAPASKSSGSFTVSGTVVNSVTGEPIGRALVRISGVAQRTAFSDGEGRFQIDGLPAGSVEIGVQKPGYFSPQELNRSTINKLVTVGPETGPMLLKLTPQSVIYGRVTDAAGQPIEQLPVHLTERSVQDGRQRRSLRGVAQTDEDGRFRFANLMPGTYSLEAGPGSEGVRLLADDKKPKTGYPSLYYPGAPDLASASPIQLGVGQQAEADFSMTAVPVYHISGTLTGYLPDQGVRWQVLNPSGEQVPVPSRVNVGMGTFDIDAVPAGSYVLKASSQAGDQVLQAEMRLNVASNVDNVHLGLAPAITIPVVVRAESRTSISTVAGWDSGPPPIYVRLTRLDSSPSGAFMSEERGNQNTVSIELKRVDPGKYAVDLMPNGRWYVQSAVYGETNLLYEDLTVTPGQNYPMEIVLRDEGATLTGSVKSADGTSAPATVLVVPQSTARRGARVVQSFPQNGFTQNALAPGEYLVFAFDHIDKIEYANPEVLQPYASQAAHVTLSSGQESHVVLNLIRTEDGE